MKCLVCGKNYEAAECPRCHFPDIQIVGDREKALETMRPTIERYRTTFLNSVNVFLVIFRWKAQGGDVVLDREEKRLLGVANKLMEKETWLAEKFARIPNQKDITATISIEREGEVRTVQVAIPNLQNPELQQLGASIDSHCNLRLLLRNDTEKPTMSQPVALFAE